MAQSMTTLDVDVNTMIEAVRRQKEAARVAAKAPLPAEKLQSWLTEAIRNVVGVISQTEVRRWTFGEIAAKQIILNDGSVYNSPAKFYDVYSVVVPALKMKRGYKIFAKIEEDIPTAGHPMPPRPAERGNLYVVPAMWRRVLCLPNSRSVTGGPLYWFYQFRPHKWDGSGISHKRSVNDIQDLETYVR